MTATTEGQKAKKSKGFTIDSIMGTESERQTDKRAESPEFYDNTRSSSSKVSHRHRSIDSDHDGEDNRHRNEYTHDRAHARTHERTNEHLESERLRSKADISGLDNLDSLTSRINTSSLHRDAMRDINFSSANIRDGIRTSTSPETLKHFHEAFLQNPGASAALGMQLGGHFDAQRQFNRHPLAALNMGGYPPHLASHPQVHPMLLNGGRDLRHLHPYIAERYPGFMLPRYGGGVPGLFFQPYRKPKRIRTAFSPTQLLQLEKSFEKSHYVVGQERKDLASELQLSETQVKVWFQNRRTKYKRTKSEDGCGTSHDGHDASYPDSNDESDISDIDDIDDVGNSYGNAPHVYQNPIQTF